jgi:hypothetical protein
MTEKYNFEHQCLGLWIPVLKKCVFKIFYNLNIKANRQKRPSF